jgi:hypothetical protein
MKNIMKNHWFILVPAFIIGLMVVLPNIVSIHNAGSGFAGIYPTFNDDESYYLSITNEAYGGQYDLGNPFIKELKGEPSLQPLLGEDLLAYEARSLGMSVPKTFVLNDFILTFLGVILLYILFFCLTKSKSISSIFSFLFYFIMSFSFGRPVNPQLSFIALLLGLIIIWKLASEKYTLKKSLIWSALLAIVFGALIYMYPFYWTTIIVLYAVVSISLFALEKDFLYHIKNWLIFGGLSFVIALPYLLNVLKSMADPSFAEASLRNGMISTHFPGALFNVAFIFFCLPIIYLAQNYFEDRKKLWFCYVLAISGVGLNWQNIITGKGLQFSSHYYLVSILFVFLILSVVTKVLLRSWADGLPKTKKYMALFLIASLLLVVVYKQKGEIMASLNNVFHPTDISKSQDAWPVFDWLNENSSPNSVIYTLCGDCDLLPVYTQDNFYQTAYAGMSLVSDDELENRWVIQNFWSDVNAKYMTDNERSIWLNKFVDTYQSSEVRRKILQFVTGRKYAETVLMDPKYIDEVLTKYKQFKQEGFEKAIKTYLVDYVILDTNNAGYNGLEEKFKKYPFLIWQAKINNFVIYKVQ